MLGLPLDEQICGFCQKVFGSGFPVKRVQIGMSTLHPRYGSHTFLWRADTDAIEHTRYERAESNRDFYLKSPIHHMRSRGLLSLRRRMDGSDTPEFPLFHELRSEGLVDYAARLVPFDHQQVEDVASGLDKGGDRFGEGRGVDGIFFSCATDEPEGFDDEQLDQVINALPYLAVSVKLRLTYDIANTVLGTYLGVDAGHRVLKGEIERRSAKAIRAIIWFSDLRGFTALTDTLPRDLLVETLDDYLEVMAEPVKAHNGQILKIMGDGLLATFDLTGKDDKGVCQEVLAAATELHSTLPTFNGARRVAGKPIMDFGLALHMGEVFYGNIGASNRLDFTVIGPAVNEASRIQALCRSLDRNILVSSTFKAAAGNKHGLEPLGFHTLRGVREPQELFGLVT
ncbi:MAG: adenylate/guanylate cyclase domain-containing protein [Pseudomonadota bacterium]